MFFGTGGDFQQLVDVGLAGNGRCVGVGVLCSLRKVTDSGDDGADGGEVAPLAALENKSGCVLLRLGVPVSADMDGVVVGNGR